MLQKTAKMAPFGAGPCRIIPANAMIASNPKTPVTPIEIVGGRVYEMSSSAPPREEAEAVELSIVMPCLNEARTLETCIRKAVGCMQRHAISGEIIVADNGSTDGSQELARGLGARVVDVERRGYGAALHAGIMAARGKFVIMGDSDDSYDFNALYPFVAKLREGNDIVLGNRFKGGIKPGAMPPLHQYLGNPGLTLLARIFFKTPSGDVYCGLRGFRRDAAIQMDLQSPGMEFALEMVVKASMLRLKIAEVPTTLSPDGRDRAPHLKTWKDGRRSLRFYVMCSPRWVFFYPGLLMFLAGLVLGGMIFVRPVQLGTVTLDVHTMLYCAAGVIMGFKAMSFSVFAKMHALNLKLIPEDPVFENQIAAARLEYVLALAVTLIFAGLFGSISAVNSWQDTSFGDLDPFRMMRLTIPSVTAMTLGFQIAVSSLYLSLLKSQLRRRKD